MAAGAVIGILGALGALGLIAATSSSASAKPKEQTFTLDANMPDGLRNQVLAALTQENDPATLEQFAQSIEKQYPLSSHALRIKEAQLLGRPYPAPPVPPGPT